MCNFGVPSIQREDLLLRICLPHRHDGHVEKSRETLLCRVDEYDISKSWTSWMNIKCAVPSENWYAIRRRSGLHGDLRGLLKIKPSWSLSAQKEKGTKD